MAAVASSGLPSCTALTGGQRVAGKVAFRMLVAANMQEEGKSGNLAAGRPSTPGNLPRMAERDARIGPVGGIWQKRWDVDETSDGGSDWKLVL